MISCVAVLQTINPHCAVHDHIRNMDAISVADPGFVIGGPWCGRKPAAGENFFCPPHIAVGDF